MTRTARPIDVRGIVADAVCAQLPRAVHAGQTFDGIVTNVDMAQTILDAARVDHHRRIRGRSFWPDLVGRQKDRIRMS